VVVEAVHNNKDAQLFWHLDNAYVGSTVNLHQLALEIKPGLHHLLIIDEHGNQVTVQFTGY